MCADNKNMERARHHFDAGGFAGGHRQRDAVRED
jgi:hypothetical protein